MLRTHTLYKQDKVNYTLALLGKNKKIKLFSSCSPSFFLFICASTLSSPVDEQKNYQFNLKTKA